MKASLNALGEIEITAETELELYALNCWYENHKENDLVHNFTATYKDEECTISPSVIIHTSTIEES